MGLAPPSPRQAGIIWFSLTGLAIGVLLGLIALLIWGLGKALQLLAPVLWPIAAAGVLAYLLDPLVDLLENRGVRRTRAILMVFAAALLVIGGLFASVAPQVVVETREFVRRVPAYAARLELKAQSFLANPPQLVQRLLQREDKASGLAVPDPAASDSPAESYPTGSAPATNSTSRFDQSLNPETVQKATVWIAQTLPAIGSWLFGQVGRVASWFGVLVALALIPVYTFYFLMEKQGISSSWTDYLPVADSAFKKELVFVLRSINGYLISFFRGQVLVAVCDGFLYAAGFLLIGLPYAVLLGAAAVILTMIPFLGAIVTCVAALIISIVTFGDWLHPLLVLAVFGSVQTIEGLVLSPKILGGRVGLHPVTIIIAVMAGTTLLGGLLGGILAIPLTAALRVIMFRYVWKRPQPKTA